jgi:hypothetical protein
MKMHTLERNQTLPESTFGSLWNYRESAWCPKTRVHSQTTLTKLGTFFQQNYRAYRSVTEPRLFTFRCLVAGPNHGDGERLEPLVSDAPLQFDATLGVQSFDFAPRRVKTLLVVGDFSAISICLYGDLCVERQVQTPPGLPLSDDWAWSESAACDATSAYRASVVEGDFASSSSIDTFAVAVEENEIPSRLLPAIDGSGMAMDAPDETYIPNIPPISTANPNCSLVADGCVYEAKSDAELNDIKRVFYLDAKPPSDAKPVAVADYLDFDPNQLRQIYATLLEQTELDHLENDGGNNASNRDLLRIFAPSHVSAIDVDGMEVDTGEHVDDSPKYQPYTPDITGVEESNHGCKNKIQSVVPDIAVRRPVSPSKTQRPPTPAPDFVDKQIDSSPPDAVPSSLRIPEEPMDDTSIQQQDETPIQAPGMDSPSQQDILDGIDLDDLVIPDQTTVSQQSMYVTPAQDEFTFNNMSFSPPSSHHGDQMLDEATPRPSYPVAKIVDKAAAASNAINTTRSSSSDVLFVLARPPVFLWPTTADAFGNSLPFFPDPNMAQWISIAGGDQYRLSILNVSYIYKLRDYCRAWMKSNLKTKRWIDIANCWIHGSVV